MNGQVIRLMVKEYYYLQINKVIIKVLVLLFSKLLKTKVILWITCIKDTELKNERMEINSKAIIPKVEKMDKVINNFLNICF